MTLPETADSIPAQFGRYRILRSLGQGGMGAVYLARDTQLEREVALKVPHFDVDDDSIERFYREARVAATIRHPNLCPVYDVGEFDGRHYITMAYIAGRSLDEFVQPDKLLPQRQAAILMRKIVRALDVAHQNGIVHRDLKPSNIMLDEQQEPVVMDFGLARRVDSDESRLTAAGALLGTPAYMPPEQVAGDLSRIGPRSDIYSAGVILYELLTGEVPFAGPVTAVLAQVLSADPLPPSSLRPGIDPQLEAICLKAMAREPDDRYPAMQDFADAVTVFLKTGSRATGGPVAAPADENSGVAGRRRPALKIAAAAVVGVLSLALLSAILFAVVSPGDNHPGETTADTTRHPSPAAADGADDIGIPATDSAARSTTGDWQTLFNGQDLTGWTVLRLETKGGVQLDSNAWTVQDGFMTCMSDKTTAVISSAEFGDFELEMQFRLPQRGGFTVLLRSAAVEDGDKPFGVPVLEESLFNALVQSKKKVKREYLLAAARISSALHSSGEWNHLRIRCAGDSSAAQLEVELNGQSVFDGPIGGFWADAGNTGSVAIFSPNGTAKGSAYCNLRIKELP